MPEVFAANKLARLEIGCGKGGFLCETAMREPDVEFYAIEKISNVVISAMEKAKAANLDNVRFVIDDATRLLNFVPAGFFDRIYINFSDPWPKARHAKNRLTHIDNLLMYKRVLREGGQLWFKTDNEEFFDFSIGQFDAAGYTVLWETRDLHSSEYAAQNVMTEYEERFSGMGMRIFSARVSPN
ncbi:MAG: tRNA (guanosine(46)-N7)-methyltransferase TrmB [Clostridiales bacterium]|nr:tRNA (guanosine(46)-N7)-methyltransferase TrmB [Clostridiales bacterium]